MARVSKKTALQKIGLGRIISKDKEAANLFDSDSFQLTKFHQYHRQTYDLTIKIIDEFITELRREFYLSDKKERNSKLIKDKINNDLLLRFIREIDINKGFSNVLGLNNKLDRYLLTEFLNKDFQTIKTFLLLLIPGKNKKDLMQKLGIYKTYEPTGNKTSDIRDLIYASIPNIQYRLEKQYGGIKKGKSDLFAAVVETIKFLVSHKNAKKFHEGIIKFNSYTGYRKIYDGYCKFNKSLKTKETKDLPDNPQNGI